MQPIDKVGLEGNIELTDKEEKVDNAVETEKGSINDLKQQRTASEDAQGWMDQFRPIHDKNKEKKNTRDAQLVLNDPSSTLRSTTKAQAKLGYTQTSAMLTWQNISCDNDNDIILFPVCGYVKPKQMLCVLGGGDDSGIPELFRILRDPSRIYKSKEHGTYVAHGDILLNGLPPGKFYNRYVIFLSFFHYCMQPLFAFIQK